MQTFPCPYLKSEAELTDEREGILLKRIQTCCQNICHR